MIYYAFLWFIRKYAINHLKFVFGIVALISLIVYIFWFPYKYEVSERGMYGISTLYRWIPYFGFMLLGAYIGLNRTKLEYNGIGDFIKLMICLVIFYGIQFASMLYRPIAPIQIVTLIPLMGVIVYMYKWCNNSFFHKIYHNKYGYPLIMFVSGLCLESYLIQFAFFTSSMNWLWPLNIVLVMILILICSYIVRCAARLFVQIFRTEDIDWKAIINYKQ